MGDGAVIHVAAGAAIEAADPSGVCRRQRQAELGLHPLAGRGREGRASAIVDREPRRAATTRSMPRSSWSSATRRRSTTSRSTQARGAARREPAGGDRRARRSSTAFAFTAGARLVRNQIFVRFAGEGTHAGIRGVSLLKGKEHVDTTLLIEHAAGHCAEPRAVQVGARRRKPRRVPGQDRRRAARAEDRRQDDDARAAAVGRGRGRQQAGAGNLRRRRALRPRRDRRRARRGPQVLSDVARHSAKRSRGAADPGLRRRGDRGDRARGHPRGADDCRASTGWGRGR